MFTEATNDISTISVVGDVVTLITVFTSRS